MASTTVTTLQAVKNALSAARMGTYEAATGAIGNDPAALALYAWNAQVSGALLMPLHICEVVVRNAVSEALEATYGHQWPWSSTFEHSLPNPSGGYSPRKDLQNVRKSMLTTGKLIPELKFVFWQKMFTGRHDTRLWNPHLTSVLPNLDGTKSVNALRQNVYQELEQIRALRNRIAHHEPIFNRNLTDDFQRIVDLVEFRCQLTADWMIKNQQATAIINVRP
jgi:hypothetical protein